MKKLILILLLLPSLAWAQAIDFSKPYARMGVVSMGAGVAAASAFCASATSTPNATGVICEDFEGSTQCISGYSSNCRAAWNASVNGTPDFDYGTAIDGTYSLNAPAYTNAASISTSRTFTESAGATYYGYFKVKLVNIPAVATSKIFVQVKGNGAGTLAGSITLKNISSAVHITCTAAGGTVSSDSTATVTEGETYNFWWKFIPENPNGSGNAEFHCAFSTTTTKPSDPSDNYVKSVNGTTEYAVDTFQAEVEYSSGGQCSDVVIDNIFIDDADITGVPN